jgi:hypothetical protein
MKIVAAFTVLALISISVGGASDPLSPAARDLLQKPRIGPAIFTLRDRTTVQGNVVRVTNQYVVFQQCRNVDVAKIARIKYLPPNGDYLNPAETAALYTLLAPYLVGRTIRSTFADRKLIGIWQSLLPPTGGAGTWVEFHEPNFVDRNLIHVRRGSYRLEGETLKLTYNDNLAEETVSISFNCNQMTLNLPGPLTLTWYDNPSNVAAAPIVGHWLTGIRTGYWQFKADIPPGIPEEEWSAKLSHGRLFLTPKGKTTEYEPRDSRL